MNQITEWKEIEKDGVPDSGCLVLVAIVVEGYETEYGIGILEYETWWHSIDPDGDDAPTHWLDIRLLPPEFAVRILSFRNELIDRPTISGFVITSPKESP